MSAGPLGGRLDFAPGVRRALERALRAHPGREVGGLLFGAGFFGAGFSGARSGRVRVDAVVQLHNRAPEPWRELRFDPDACRAARADAAAAGREVVGTWHTHPGGRAALSRADAYALRDGETLLVLAVRDGASRAAAWRLAGGRFTSLVLAPSSLDARVLAGECGPAAPSPAALDQYSSKRSAASPSPPGCPSEP